MRTFSAGGITLSVTAWGYTYSSQDNAMERARLGRWSTGLGTCNASESPCSSPGHQVDNVGADDWVLFMFSTPVDITSVRIDPYGNYDRDVSYYLGNIATIPLDLQGKNYGQLPGLGFGAIQSDSSSASDNYRDVTITGGYVNALLFGGYKGGNDQDDYFKIRSLTVTRRVSVPEPATMSLLVFGTVGVGAFGLRRRKSPAQKAATE
jgi:hypothetical protein